MKVGGPNASGRSWQEDSHEYEDAYGVTHKGNVPRNEDTGQYVGQYRIEIIPTTPSLSDVFLTVVEVGNANMAMPSAAMALQSIDLVGARVGNRIAVFNRASGEIGSGEVTVDAAGAFGIHISDLTPNAEYEITVGGSRSIHSASTAGTLYLQQTLMAGTRIALRATGSAAVAPQTAPANVRYVEGRVARKDRALMRRLQQESSPSLPGWPRAGTVNSTVTNDSR